MRQATLRFPKPKWDATPVDMSAMDFGPEFGYNFRLPIVVQTRGMAYRYGRPMNKITLGRPLCDEPQFRSLPAI